MALDIRQHIEEWLKELEEEAGEVKIDVVRHVQQFGDWFATRHPFGVTPVVDPTKVFDTHQANATELVSTSPDAALLAHAALTDALVAAGHLPDPAPPVETSPTATVAVDVKHE